MSKKNQKMSKKEQNERLTNWYMINLCWGVVGLLGLIAIYRGYRNMSVLPAMQTIQWVLTGLFAATTVALFVIGKVKNCSRARNYAILSGVCTLVGLWMVFYNKIRLLLESVARTILGNPNLIVSSYWIVWIPMIGIGVYLVGAFIYYAIKVTRK